MLLRSRLWDWRRWLCWHAVAASPPIREPRRPRQPLRRIRPLPRQPRHRKMRKKWFPSFLRRFAREITRQRQNSFRRSPAKRPRKRGRYVVPPPNDGAKIEVEDAVYPTPSHDIAHVPTRWIDLDETGKPRTDKATWVCRLEHEGWRVAAFAAYVFDGEDPLLLNFEDLEDMAKKQTWLREEIDATKTGGDSAAKRRQFVSSGKKTSRCVSSLTDQLPRGSLGDHGVFPLLLWGNEKLFPLG